ncbi:hypothetical protein EVAR_98986_1 [Eumeta japonica]|uniref:Uncharacterized protein n=1 Tax=Eumeta variegata TaxID=151549 RepID=A0A4C1YRC4_EUMVA|nr:hypothetical protein EVAR_98986_1 [Eumeta japonica]
MMESIHRWRHGHTRAYRPIAVLKEKKLVVRRRLSANTGVAVPAAHLASLQVTYRKPYRCCLSIMCPREKIYEPVALPYPTPQVAELEGRPSLAPTALTKL